MSETTKGVATDDKGFFTIDSLCKGTYHLQISHIGCENQLIHLGMEQDTTITIYLNHTTSTLTTVIVKGKAPETTGQSTITLNRKKLEDNIDKNLSELLENEAGVHLMKNGNGIAKPVVNGLYGNRLQILNNGIVQSGQQWGNDHSPEIDPFSADKISILKGVNAIEYSGGNLGSIILVEPKRIANTNTHLHGQVNYAYESNGRGHVLHARIGQYTPFLAWRLSGTLKKYGDQHTSNYLLNNTGIEEASLALQLEKSWNDKLFVDFYASTFNTRLGVLRGAHVGNLTDLETALSRAVPFFTDSVFSYQIEAPRQNVSHHLAKIKAKYIPTDHQTIEFVSALQVNNRKEFDVRRGGRTDRPALSLLQYTLNVEAKYKHFFENNWVLKLGNQNILTDNTNNPETGISPLIPDYISWKSGLFISLSKQIKKVQFSFGGRYDFEQQNVATISSDLPRRIVRYDNSFHNITGLLAVTFDLKKGHSLLLNSGYAMRNPAINELYSAGLHQGVSGIEEGNVNLETEKAIKSTLAYEWTPNPNFTFNALLYHQHFFNYIFLEPQDQFRLTIRGAFPVFEYKQTNANIYGLDVSTQFTIGDSWLGMIKYSYLRGNDTENNTPLVFMPPNSLYSSLGYEIKKGIKISKHIQLEQLAIEVNSRLVFEQTNLLATQDFAPPPSTYHLLGIKFSANIVIPNYQLRCFVKIDNTLNTAFRDYLNRQRYFADDLGRSITIGINCKF
jgi:iron complex outermembrane receptor protein